MNIKYFFIYRIRNNISMIFICIQFIFIIKLLHQLINIKQLNPSINYFINYKIKE